MHYIIYWNFLIVVYMHTHLETAKAITGRKYTIIPHVITLCKQHLHY